MLSAAVLALAVLLSGCAAEPVSVPPAPSTAPSTVPSAARPSSAAAPVVEAAPVKHHGWSEADVPVFGPAPAPDTRPLPPGDLVPYLHRIDTRNKVAFITIDDGYIKDPEAAALLAAARVPVTLFLTTDAVRDDPDYIRPLIDAGAVVEAHTVSHPMLRGMPYAAQKREICGSADRLATWYKRRPVLFRPPYGAQDDNTLRAARDCGMKAAFMWKETVDKGKVRYQEGKRIQPGDIVLMHFRKSFVKDFLATLRAIRKAGLTPALLEDYVR